MMHSRSGISAVDFSILRWHFGISVSTALHTFVHGLWSVDRGTNTHGSCKIRFTLNYTHLCFTRKQPYRAEDDIAMFLFRIQFLPNFEACGFDAIRPAIAH